MKSEQLQPVAALKAFVTRHGSQTRAGRALGVTQGYVSDLLNGRRDFSDSMLRKLGLKRVSQIVARAS